MGGAFRFGLAMAVLLGSAGTAHAHPFFATPPHPVPNFTVSSCGTCHDDTATRTCPTDGFTGTRNLNLFGRAFCDNGQAWDEALAGTDSDGDRWTNGQELGDPFGRWRSGDSDPTSRGGHPGFSATEPSNFDLCSVGAYNDCTSGGRGGSCSDSFNGTGRWTCSCDTPQQTGTSYLETSGHTWTGGPGTVRYTMIGPFTDRCSDVNECTSGSPPDCGVGSCNNLDGDYECVCDGSMSEVCTMMSGGRCRFCALGCDTDNCDDSPDACVPTATTPFFMCVCPAGYMGSGVGSSGCIDIDECDPNPCGVGTCSELFPAGSDPDGYSCSCPTGYEAPATGGTCINIDECESAPPRAAPYDGFNACSPGACAELAPGAFWSCSCPPTHVVLARGDGREVCDLDECLDVTISRCSENATCANNLGGWTCTCDPGYRDVLGDGTSCPDIDECMEGTDACDVEATCMNLDGTYSCACNAFYRGSGFECADVDECAEGTDGCVLNERCVNNVGMAPDCECRTGYSRTDPMAPCVVACGDAMIGPGEECDDGDTDPGDGCDALCEIEDGWACSEPMGTASVCMETCGDGFIDSVEECDNGPANSDTDVDACRINCRRAGCGDGVVDTGDECDDGASNSDTAADGCRTTCDFAYCGDGVLDTGEICDVGGGVPGASVVGTCTTMCLGDAGLDATDPPVLTGGACSCRVGPASSLGAGWLGLLVLGLLCRFRRRRTTR